MCHFKPRTFIVPSTWDHRWGFVWHNNESIGFKVAQLIVQDLICHKDKTKVLFWTFPKTNKLHFTSSMLGVIVNLVPKF